MWTGKASTSSLEIITEGVGDGDEQLIARGVGTRFVASAEPRASGGQLIACGVGTRFTASAEPRASGGQLIARGVGTRFTVCPLGIASASGASVLTRCKASCPVCI